MLANTALPTCDVAFEGAGYIGQAFYDWKAHSHETGGLGAPGAVGRMLRRGGRGPSAGPDGEISEAEADAYQAPFPDANYLAGIRAWAELVPTPPTDPTGRPQPVGGAENLAAWRVFGEWRRPVLCAFGEEDIVFPPAAAQKPWLERCPGTRGQPHQPIAGAGHFVQDGGGAQLAAAICDFIEATPREGGG